MKSTPEALMRSRYSAFVAKDSEYLLSSWHPSTRPQALDLSTDTTQWCGLTVLASTRSGNTGTVHFKAVFKEQAGAAQVGFYVLEERSNFVFEDEQWFYLDGDSAVAALKPQRNDSCLCGSGKKFKKCCGL